jgi:hypothetical protein
LDKVNEKETKMTLTMKPGMASLLSGKPASRGGTYAPTGEAHITLLAKNVPNLGVQAAHILEERLVIAKVGGQLAAKRFVPDKRDVQIMLTAPIPIVIAEIQQELSKETSVYIDFFDKEQPDQPYRLKLRIQPAIKSKLLRGEETQVELVMDPNDRPKVEPPAGGGARKTPATPPPPPGDENLDPEIKPSSEVKPEPIPSRSLAPTTPTPGTEVIPNPDGNTANPKPPSNDGREPVRPDPNAKEPKARPAAGGSPAGTGRANQTPPAQADPNASKTENKGGAKNTNTGKSGNQQKKNEDGPVRKFFKKLGKRVGIS